MPQIQIFGHTITTQKFKQGNIQQHTKAQLKLWQSTKYYIGYNIKPKHIILSNRLLIGKIIFQSLNK